MQTPVSLHCLFSRISDLFFVFFFCDRISDLLWLVVYVTYVYAFRCLFSKNIFLWPVIFRISTITIENFFGLWVPHLDEIFHWMYKDQYMTFWVLFSYNIWNKANSSIFCYSYDLSPLIENFHTRGKLETLKVRENEEVLHGKSFLQL